MYQDMQEFHCPTSGGGCGGYFTCGINVNLTGWVNVICPSCQHNHSRKYDNGVIVEEGRYTGQPSTDETEELLGNPASFSMKPKAKLSKNNPRERDAVIIDANRCEFLADAWRRKLGEET